MQSTARKKKNRSFNEKNASYMFVDDCISVFVFLVIPFQKEFHSMNPLYYMDFNIFQIFFGINVGINVQS